MDGVKHDPAPKCTCDDDMGPCENCLEEFKKKKARRREISTTPGPGLDDLVEDILFGRNARRATAKTQKEYEQIRREFTPPYSSSMRMAWKVVERLKEMMAHVQMQSIPGGWSARFMVAPVGLMPEEIAETAPHAICLAALRAIGAI